jgi:hypothetical protein
MMSLNTITHIHRRTGTLTYALHCSSPDMRETIFCETGLEIPPMDYAVWSGFVWVHMSRARFKERLRSALGQTEIAM